jgi:hypothetical protein
MDQGVQKFFSKIETLQKKGLPGLKVINDKLMTLPDYKKRLAEVSKDSSKFAGIQGSITGKAFLDALQLDIIIQHEIRYIFLTKPTFAKYTEMDEVYQRLLKVTVPSHLRWEELCDRLDWQMSCPGPVTCPVRRGCERISPTAYPKNPTCSCTKSTISLIS